MNYTIKELDLIISALEEYSERWTNTDEIDDLINDIIQQKKDIIEIDITDFNPLDYYKG